MTIRESTPQEARAREAGALTSVERGPDTDVNRLREQLRMAEAYLRIQANAARILGSQAPMLRACPELALSVCHELAWDYVGVWTVNVESWTLRCRDAWIRPGLPLSWFEEATFPKILPPSAGIAGFRTAVSFPLKYGDDVLAVVDVFSKFESSPRAPGARSMPACG